MTSANSHRSIKSASYPLILCMIFALGPAWAFAEGAHAEESDPPDRVARLSYIQGDVASLLAEQPDNAREWSSVTLNRPFTSGDTLWVKDDSRAELQMGSATLRLDQNSDLTLDQLSDDVMALRLSNGELNLLVKRMRNDETISVDTPNGAVRVQRPGEYRIGVTDRGTRTRVKVYSGEVQLDTNHRSSPLHARQSAEMFAGNRGLMTQDDIDARDAFDDWSNERNRREMASTSSRYVSDDVIGYDELDRHGSWSSEPEFGDVWYPNSVMVDWAPYRYGRWVSIAPWGWTWIDDAPWGFAPFHYGRWAHVHGRWGWVPGPRHIRAVYAPALVAWMGAPGINVSVSIGPSIGWFPLAPREVFIPGYRCSTRHRYSVNIANTLIVNNTVIDRAYDRATNHGIAHIDYANRNIRDAVTVVDRDHFVRAQPTREHIVHVNEGELRRWQPQVSAPGATRDSFRDQVPRVISRTDPQVGSQHDSRGSVSRFETRDPKRGTWDSNRDTNSRFRTQDNGAQTSPPRAEPHTEPPTRYAPNRERQFEFNRQDNQHQGAQRVDPRASESRVQPSMPQPQDNRRYDNRGSENRGSENRRAEDRAPVFTPPPAPPQVQHNAPAPNDGRRGDSGGPNRSENRAGEQNNHREGRERER